MFWTIPAIEDVFCLRLFFRFSSIYTTYVCENGAALLYCPRYSICVALWPRSLLLVVLPYCLLC